MFKRRGDKGSMKGGSRIAKQALKVLGGLCFLLTLPPVIYLLQWEYSQERLELNPYVMLIAWELLSMVTLCSVIYLWVQRQVSRPVETIIDLIDRLNPQARKARAHEVYEHHEIEHLFHSVQGLSSAYETKQRALVEHQNNLEKEVAERTEHLKKASQAKSEFIAKMSHEIRTPMNGVLGSAELLKDSSLNKQQLQYLNTIQSSGNALLEIINDILDYSKIEAGKMEINTEPYNLEQLMDECISIFSYQSVQSKVGLLALFEKEVPLHLVGDPVRIKQIIINFLSNAFKFTLEGQILIKVSCVKSLGELSRLIKVEVIDSGIGIEFDKQKLIFDSFTQADGSTTRKFGGTGLGLTICRRLASLMGGEVGLTSQAGVGSNFWFTLEQAELKEVGQIKSTVIPQMFAQKHLLLVEQNAHFRPILAYMLRNWGFKVTALPSVAAAGAALSSKKSENPFDLVFYLSLVDGSDSWEEVSGFTEEQAGFGLPLLYAFDSGEINKNKKVLMRLQRIFTRVVVLEKPIRFWPLRESLLEVFDDPLDHSGAHDAAAGIGLDRGCLLTNGLRVLVAEDNTVNQKIIDGMLKKIGIVPDITNNGVEAIKWFSDQLRMGRGYDLVLMDCEMPELDGWGATKEIRLIEQQHGVSPVTIIALSAHALNIKRERAKEAGMDSFLSKPISLKALIDEIDAL